MAMGPPQTRGARLDSRMLKTSEVAGPRGSKSKPEWFYKSPGPEEH